MLMILWFCGWMLQCCYVVAKVLGVIIANLKIWQLSSLEHTKKKLSQIFKSIHFRHCFSWWMTLIELISEMAWSVCFVFYSLWPQDGSALTAKTQTAPQTLISHLALISFTYISSSQVKVNPLLSRFVSFISSLLSRVFPEQFLWL